MTRRTENTLNERVWEIDALRGLLILGVLAVHLYHTVDAFCIDGYYKIDSYAYVKMTDPLHFWFDWGEDGIIFRAFLTQKLRDNWFRSGVDAFFVISGISVVFSRNSLRRCLRLLCGAAFLSVFTMLLAVFTGDKEQYIRFGVLHCYAACHLIQYFFLDGRRDSILLITAAGSLIVGYYLRFNTVYSEFSLLVPFGIRENGVYLRDYWPVFPMLGWFLIGVVLGQHWYKDKKTLFPRLKLKKWHRPFCFLGRYSGWIYCGHMVVYTLVFCGIGYLFDLF